MLNINVTGNDVKIYRHTFVYNGEERVRYSVRLAQKKMDDSWESAFMDVQFKKDAKLPRAESFTINIHNAWLKFRTTERDGVKTTRYSVFVSDFSDASAPPQHSQKQLDSVEDSFSMAEDDIPF